MTRNWLTPVETLSEFPEDGFLILFIRISQKEVRWEWQLSELWR
jgi:hypothetical protein